MRGRGAGCAQINIIHKNYQVSYSHFEGVLYVSVRVHANANRIFVCLFNGIKKNLKARIVFL